MDTEEGAGVYFCWFYDGLGIVYGVKGVEGLLWSGLIEIFALGLAGIDGDDGC